jgi:murein tripeptide amidase MpaA
MTLDPKARYRVTITANEREGRFLTDLAAKRRVPLAGLRHTPGRGYKIDAYLLPRQMERLKQAGYRFTIHENIDQQDRQRQTEGREAAARRAKRGRYGDVMWAGGYLTVDEVESVILSGSKRFSKCTERVTLPHKTWEKRLCHALRIGEGSRRRKRPAVCIISGVHGREWGGPDIVVYFGLLLLTAYSENRGVRLGSKKFTAEQIRRLVRERNIFLFPQVNPDGRLYSMDRHPFWRKNRRPAPRGRAHRSVGVDINRNFDFMWDFERHFAPDTVGSSKKPSDYETYIGPRATSEPETRNVVWLLDHYPQIGYFIDLHSYSETILYNWGSDENQSHDPAMTFTNSSFDGKRGRIHDAAYREHIEASDERTAIDLARAMSRAIARVRGRKYRVQQAVGLYPTGGAADDYAYSRHIQDRSKTKVLAFTIEWGRSRCPTPFHPAYPEMRKVMREVTAGLLEFCLRAE